MIIFKTKVFILKLNFYSQREILIQICVCIEAPIDRSSIADVLQCTYFETFRKVHKKHCTKTEVFHYGCLQEIRPNQQFPADLVTFTEEIRNGKLHFLCSEKAGVWLIFLVSFWHTSLKQMSHFMWSYVTFYVFPKQTNLKNHPRNLISSFSRLWSGFYFTEQPTLRFQCIRYVRMPAANYTFKVNNRNTRARCKIYSKLIIKTPEWYHTHAEVQFQ